MSTKRTRDNGNRERAKRETFLRAIAYRGLLTRVAEKAQVTRQHVSMVMSGRRRSAKIERALLAEIARIDREAAA